MAKRRLAALTLACPAASLSGQARAGQYYCGNTPVGTARTCPGGGLAVYRADPVPEHRALPVKPITRDEMDRMNEATRREAARLAKVWAADGRLSRDQVEAIDRGTCVLMPYANPELRCVMR